MVRFEITPLRGVNVSESGKKYVSYKLSIHQDYDEPARNATFLERRYTHFLALYNCLKKQFPDKMSSIDFPKKVMMGNFEPELHTCRSRGFGSFLDFIAKEPKLREARSTVCFFQDIELQDAKKLMLENRYDQALTILENIFMLLNKVYTDRSRAVLIALCRLVACGLGNTCDTQQNYANLAGPSERWASLALRRFDGVCDTDLLSLYVPLIRACICIWNTIGKDINSLETILEDMKKRGMRVDSDVSLMCAIDKLEQTDG